MVGMPRRHKDTKVHKRLTPVMILVNSFCGLREFTPLRTLREMSLRDQEFFANLFCVTQSVICNLKSTIK